jgi:translation initiation factor 5A
MGNEVQLMDMKTYETFNLPVDEDMMDKLVPGNEIQYIEAMGRRKITRT